MKLTAMKPTAMLFLLAPLFSTAALASSYTGPGANAQITTVAGALNAADDSMVVLEGRITKRLQAEVYEFKDATGSIHVEIDDEKWPAQQVSDTAKVRLHGEVDRDMMGREVDVERLEVIK